MRWTALFLLLLVMTPLDGAGQGVRVAGRVIADEDGRPLAAADISIRRPDGGFIAATETDSTGSFSFFVTSVPAVRIYAQRYGYESTVTPLLYFDGRSFIQVEVRLATDAVLLAPLEVVVWSEVDESPLLDNFRMRYEEGLGVYFTRTDIERRRPMYVSDLLRSVPGVSLVGGGGGQRPRIELTRTAGMRCRTQIFLDGMLMTRGGVDDVRLDDLVSPGSVEGIEVYRGLSTIPPEFLNADAECGVVAVWTRRGGRGR